MGGFRSALSAVEWAGKHRSATTILPSANSADQFPPALDVKSALKGTEFPATFIDRVQSSKPFFFTVTVRCPGATTDSVDGVLPTKLHQSQYPPQPHSTARKDSQELCLRWRMAPLG